MKKEEFLSRIREDLSSLTEEEMRSALKYYDEYLADRHESKEDEFEQAVSEYNLIEDLKEKLEGDEDEDFESAGDYIHSDHGNEKSGAGEFDDVNMNDPDVKKSKKNKKAKSKKAKKNNNTMVSVLLIVMVCVLLVRFAPLMVPLVVAVGASGLNFAIFNDSNTGEYQYTFERTADTLNLKVDVSIGRVNIRTTEASEIRIEAENINPDNFTSGVVNGTLEVIYRQRGIGIIPISRLTNRRPAVVDIYIPKGMIFETVDINGGVGEYNIEYINAGRLRLDSGVGRVSVNGSSIDKLKINAGVGEINISGDIGEMNIDGGVGRIRINGSIARGIKIDGGVGEIKLDLAGDINNYDVRADTGVGPIRINGERAGNFRNSNAPYRLTVDGGVGSINININ